MAGVEISFGDLETVTIFTNGPTCGLMRSKSGFQRSHSINHTEGKVSKIASTNFGKVLERKNRNFSNSAFFMAKYS